MSSQTVAAPSEDEEYQPTPKELECMIAIHKAEKAGGPRIKVNLADPKSQLRPDHPDYVTGICLIMQALGVKDTSFAEAFLMQVGNAVARGKNVSELDINFVLSVAKSIAPKDTLEAMLAVQMATVHMATMDFARRLTNAENPEQREFAQRALNKLARTFTAQMEGLKRYRSTAAQRVEVHHHHHHHQNVTVEDGGQAVVANGPMAALAGGETKTGEQPHAITHAPGETLPGNVQAIREAVPLASRERA